MPRRPRRVGGLAGRSGRVGRGAQRPSKPDTVSPDSDFTLQFDWAAEREKEKSICSSRGRDRQDSSPQRCGMQKTAKKIGLSVLFCWYCIYHCSMIATLRTMPCPKRPRGDVRCVRSAATPPDANYGFRRVTVSPAGTGEEVVWVWSAFAGVRHARSSPAGVRPGVPTPRQGTRQS